MGELTFGPHAIKARNVHIGENKDKILFILESSKTHGKDRNPQMVKLSSRKIEENHSVNRPIKYRDHSGHCICAFSILDDYIKIRPKGKSRNSDQIFVFADGSPVYPNQMRTTLRLMLRLSGFNDKLYNTHSFRIGRCCDLLKMGFEVPTIQKIGRWCSNAIYTYLR